MVDMVRRLGAEIGYAAPRMTFEEKRQLLKMLRIRVEVLDPTHAQISGIISDTIVPLSTNIPSNGRLALSS